MTFLKKYEARAEHAHSLLCVGIDPEMAKISAAYREQDRPQEAFGRAIIEATHPYAAAYKFNIAFYEARGTTGLAELEDTVAYCRETHPDIPLICDAKRGDIANTNEQYAIALFDELGFDAITVNPYMGGESLQPFLDRREKGVIVLCRTSNPGAKEMQDMVVGGKPLWQAVAERVRDEWNKNGNCLLVVGATYPEEMSALRGMMGEMTFLVPGVGGQGGDLAAAVRAGLNAGKNGLMVNASRSIIFAEDPAAEALRMRDAINAARDHV